MKFGDTCIEDPRPGLYRAFGPMGPIRPRTKIGPFFLYCLDGLETS